MPKHVKNQNGSGSIYFRERDQRWVASVVDPLTGKRAYRYAPSKAQAQMSLRDMLNRIDAGEPVMDVSVTLAEYVTMWIAGPAGNRRAPTTVGEYERRLRRHVVPVLGHKRMDRITSTDVEHLLKAVHKTGKSKKTVQAVKNAMSAMFNDARKAKAIARNPVLDAEMPLIQEKPPKEYPSTSEVQTLLYEASRASGEHARETGRILLLCAHTGARIGEILGMKWSDLRLDEDKWTVTRTVTRDEHGRRMIGERTKTGEVRVLKLSPLAIAELRVQHEYCVYQRSMATIWGEEDFVFPTERGTFKDQNNVYKQIRRFFPSWKYTPHDLRHWFATSCIDAGMSEIQVAYYLGHKSPRTTIEHYGHRSDTGQEAIAEWVTTVLSS